MNKEKLFLRFRHSRFLRKAEEKAGDPQFVANVRTSSLKLSEKVKNAGDKVKTLLDYVFGKDADLGMRIYTIAALVYFISPLDFVPDFIPGVGYLEDIAILGMMVGVVTSRILKKEKELNLTATVRDTIAQYRTPASPSNGREALSNQMLDRVFDRAKGQLNQTAQEQMDKQVRTRLIIVIISLSGAVLAAAITLILKYYFKAF